MPSLQHAILCPLISTSIHWTHFIVWLPQRGWTAAGAKYFERARNVLHHHVYRRARDQHVRQFLLALLQVQLELFWHCGMWCGICFPLIFLDFPPWFSLIFLDFPPWFSLIFPLDFPPWFSLIFPLDFSPWFSLIFPLDIPWLVSLMSPLMFFLHLFPWFLFFSLIVS